jgi:predicted kinase
MKIVILSSGPRGAGKSTYLNLVKQRHPEILFLSRDEILIELFGATSLDPYTGGHWYAAKILEERLQQNLSATDFVLIYDCWNGYSSERKGLIRKFYEAGVDKVICWQFVTPLEVCESWFYKKPDVGGYSKDACRRDYKMYYHLAQNIDEDGFDAVIQINPCQLILDGFPLIEKPR